MASNDAVIQINSAINYHYTHLVLASFSKVELPRSSGAEDQRKIAVWLAPAYVADGDLYEDKAYAGIYYEYIEADYATYKTAFDTVMTSNLEQTILQYLISIDAVLPGVTKAVVMKSTIAGVVIT